MSEAVEYRLASVAAITQLIGSLAMVALANVSAVLAIVHTSLTAGVVTCYLIFVSILLLIDVKAKKTDGRSRRLMSRWYDYDDPPLDDWENRLNERGGFAVDGGEKL